MYFGMERTTKKSFHALPGDKRSRATEVTKTHAKRTKQTKTRISFSSNNNSPTPPDHKHAKIQPNPAHITKNNPPPPPGPKHTLQVIFFFFFLRSQKKHGACFDITSMPGFFRAPILGLPSMGAKATEQKPLLRFFFFIVVPTSPYICIYHCCTVIPTRPNPTQLSTHGIADRHSRAAFHPPGSTKFQTTLHAQTCGTVFFTLGSRKTGSYTKKKEHASLPPRSVHQVLTSTQATVRDKHPPLSLQTPTPEALHHHQKLSKCHHQFLYSCKRALYWPQLFFASFLHSFEARFSPHTASTSPHPAAIDPSIARNVGLRGQGGEVVDGNRQKALPEKLLLDRHQVPLRCGHGLVQQELDDHARTAL